VSSEETSKPGFSLSKFLIGRPLETTALLDQRVTKRVGLAVFASDALSSTAYATEEILIILALAGTSASTLGVSIPIAIAIAILLAIVTISYRQTIFAYPNGGGAYIVARDNLGELPAQIAGAALLTDYILTVAVSTSAGVAQITSGFPDLLPYRVEIAISVIVVMTIVNLRGVRESGQIFAVPTYFFIFTMFATLIVGVIRAVTGSLDTVTGVEVVHSTSQSLTLFLVLRAFSSGCTALTGIEAISNGIMAFKEPRSRNAAVTLVWMSTILIALFLGITFLAHQIGALPSETETIISQIGRAVYGEDSIIYILVLAGTALILLMAANTSYAGFPRLAALAASDGFLPRQLTYRGSRLVFSWGIMGLSAFASLLVIAGNARTTFLIPLYAIGVFLSFTLSQIGMAKRWWHIGHSPSAAQDKEARQYLGKLLVNAAGALATGVVTLVFGITNFVEGAWIVVLLVPILVLCFSAIQRHYRGLARQLSLDTFHSPHRLTRYRVIIPISGVHQGSLKALHYARGFSNDLTAVYVSMDPDEAEKVKAKWSIYGEGTRLLILDSPYRLLLEPILGYIDSLTKIIKGNEAILVVVPQFVSRRWWTSILHNQTAFMLRMGLLTRPGVIIIEVPYQVE